MLNAHASFGLVAQVLSEEVAKSGEEVSKMTLVLRGGYRRTERYVQGTAVGTRRCDNREGVDIERQEKILARVTIDNRD
jgi:hypothetical protein